ncbi:PEP-CTERM sorting domain-containing protein [Sphingomonas sp.]|uniref:PEP-CTERM sorting domain-containing protein n=1 Tax=Sphingomonas sp. TaxID=28214 RepID=UPI003B3B5365
MSILSRPTLLRTLTALFAITWLAAMAGPALAERILFVGNSFTFGAGSPVRTYRPDLVRDLNREGIGGVPALFKRFAEQAGQNWDVSLETASGQDFAYHLANKRAQLTGVWDVVVLQDYSTLDKLRPGDPAAHVRDAERLAMLFKAANPRVRVLLETTWSRADLTYPPGAPYRGKSIRAMTEDIARGNALAIGSTRDLFAGTVPVGEAWLRAMSQGVADPNPYDGIAFGKVNLWTWDHYHASAAGYYLAALVIFGRVTGVDPRTLGIRERAAEDLGLQPQTAVALQRIAAEELANPGGPRPAR